MQAQVKHLHQAGHTQDREKIENDFYAGLDHYFDQLIKHVADTETEGGFTFTCKLKYDKDGNLIIKRHFKPQFPAIENESEGEIVNGQLRLY